jgi:hypothetical protein
MFSPRVFHAIATVVLVSLATVTLAEDKPLVNATAECQVIVLPVAVALKILPDLVDDMRVDGGYTRLQEMIAAGEAELVGNLVTKAALTETGTAGAVDEVRYPTEFEPPALPNPLPKENALPILKNWPIVGFTPTAFETRNVGPSIQFTPERIDPSGKLLRINIKADDVRLLQFMSYNAGRLVTGEMMTIEQPRFHSTSSHCEVWVQSGQRLLLGAHKIPGEVQKMELFVLRVLF